MLNKRGAMTSRNEISKGKLGATTGRTANKCSAAKTGEKNAATISRILGGHSQCRAIPLHLRLHLLQLLLKLGNIRFQFLNLPMLF